MLNISVVNVIIIDAKNKVLGRIATYAAKQALLGEEVKIVNCELAVITGKKDEILARYNQRRQRGIPSRGPFFPRMPDRLVRRTVRGMLPWSQTRGREAFKRVLCYVGIPEEYASQKMVSVEGADLSKVINTNFLTVKELTRLLGAKE